MNSCPACKNELAAGAAFCSSCGRKVGSEPGEDRRSRRRKDDSDLHARSMADLAALRGRIRSASQAYARRVRVRSAILAGLLPGAFALTGDIYSPWVLFPAALLLAHLVALALGGGDRWLTSSEYYSLTGSRNSSGEHRCLDCGHPGIQRKGEYRTDAVYARCGKCGYNLFVS